MCDGILNVFKLPIDYNLEKRCFPESLTHELELTTSALESGELPIYEKITLIKSTISKELLKPFSKTYTTDIEFLKEMQKLLSTKKISNDMNKVDSVWRFWQQNKNEKDFKNKYNYLDWKAVEWLNESETFLFCSSVFHISSPLISLLLPFIMLLIPFFIIHLQGVEITFEKYVAILIEVSEGNAICNLLNNFSSCTSQDKAYLVFSAMFYVFSIYQNFVLCLKFCRNLIKINQELMELKNYLSNTIIQMNYMLETTETLPKLLLFRNHLEKNRDVLRKLSSQFEEITPFGFSYNKLMELGHIMKLFYAIYEKEENVESLLYSFGFNGFLEILEGLQIQIELAKLNACSFKKPKLKKQKNNKLKINNEMTDFYYAGLVNEVSNITTNSVVFDKNLVLTGPNASGKTTLLKATLLNIIFSQQFGYGCYKSFQSIPYHHFYCYLNIIDNSGRDSLFQMESKKCNTIIETLDKYPNDRHFCVFDELFSGTNPIEAVNCGYGYLAYLCKIKNKKQNLDFLLTTHYIDLCEKLQKEKCIQICRMMTEVENGKLTFTYKLMKGLNTVNGGIEVLKQLNFPTEILKTIEEQK
jgi:energy-coupling factor transporter ATP-binding protein EcfA2